MSQNVADFQWTDTKEQAAALVARDGQTNAAIAAACGIVPRTLDRWKAHPAFVARVQEHRDAWRAAVMAEGIADRAERVRAYNDRWRKMQQVITARADEYADIPGGETGLLVRQIKSIGIGQNNTTVEEYAVDVGLLRELRAHEEQAAKELGQWSEKIDIKHVLDREIERVAADRGIPKAELAAAVDEMIAEGPA